MATSSVANDAIVAPFAERADPCIHAISAFGLTLLSDRPWTWDVGRVVNVPDKAGTLTTCPTVPICITHVNELAIGLRGFQMIYASPTGPEEPEPNLRVWHERRTDSLLFRYASGIEFHIGPAGHAITVAAPYATQEDIAVYLLGPVVGMALRLQQRLCLHAAVVEVNNHAIAIAGECGVGKSTLATYLAEHGHGILSDDIAALTQTDGVWHAEPGLPLIKLWPSGAALALGAHVELPRLTSDDWDKRYYNLGDQFVDQALPLAAIYVIENWCSDLSMPSIERVSPRDAWLALSRHGYVNYVDLQRPQWELPAWASVVRQASVRELLLPSDGADLATLAHVILEDAERCTR